MKRLITMVAVLAAVALPSLALADLGDDLKVSDHGTTAQVARSRVTRCPAAMPAAITKPQLPQR